MSCEVESALTDDDRDDRPSSSCCQMGWGSHPQYGRSSCLSEPEHGEQQHSSHATAAAYGGAGGRPGAGQSRARCRTARAIRRPASGSASSVRRRLASWWRAGPEDAAPLCRRSGVDRGAETRREALKETQKVQFRAPPPKIAVERARSISTSGSSRLARIRAPPSRPFPCRGRAWRGEGREVGRW